MAKKYSLKLFIYSPGQEMPERVGMVEKLRSVLDEKHQGQYDLEIIDVMKNPELASKEGVMTTPTLLRVLPEPKKKLVGDFAYGQNISSIHDLMKPEGET